MKPEEIFAIHPKIRWAGWATRRGQVQFAQMREGLESYTPDANDRATLEIRAQYLIETVEQECVWGGTLDHITIAFEKYVEIVIPLKTSYMAITVEKDLEPEAYSTVCRAIRALDKS